MYAGTQETGSATKLHSLYEYYSKQFSSFTVTNPVPIQYTCTRSWNDTAGTFRFSASWTLPNSTYLQMAIKNFKIIVKLVFPETGEREEYRLRGHGEVLFTVRVISVCTYSSSSIETDSSDPQMFPISLNCPTGYSGYLPPPD